MEKQFLEPVQLLKIAAQHAYAAQFMLNQNGEVPIEADLNSDALLPIVSLMHLAFELTFKAFILNEKGSLKPTHNLKELIDLNNQLVLSKQEKDILLTLSKQYAFKKGIDYDLWENRQSFHVFCEQVMNLYERLLFQIPLELQQDYQA